MGMLVFMFCLILRATMSAVSTMSIMRTVSTVCTVRAVSAVRTVSAMRAAVRAAVMMMMVVMVVIFTFGEQTCICSSTKIHVLNHCEHEQKMTHWHS